jgi:hypothetical protein
MFYGTSTHNVLCYYGLYGDNENCKNLQNSSCNLTDAVVCSIANFKQNIAFCVLRNLGEGFLAPELQVT